MSALHDPATVADELFRSSGPRSRHAHWFATEDGRGQLFAVNGSRIFGIDHEVLTALDAALEAGDGEVAQLLEQLGLDQKAMVDDEPLRSPPLHALSLAVAQKCNLGCSYCYAGQGSFGGAAKNMTWEVARRSVELLVGEASAGSRVHLSFLGGEPLANRAVIRAATAHAAALAEEREVQIGYAITTNGTLLTPEDGEFFEQHGFAVTVSLDGLREVHDRNRPFKSGAGSFDRVLERVEPLLRMQRRMQVSARVTVTPHSGELREALDFFLGMGFHSAGFSPLLHSSAGSGEMGAGELPSFLERMVECGEEFLRRAERGERYGFSNMATALQNLHRGLARPYPCGAGAGYLGVSAEGSLAACHRFVGDPEAGMGHLDSGIDPGRQNDWLRSRHVHRQSPCGDCWARYLCAGGCHHEVMARGRPACGFIRGWLHYCLAAYSRLLRTQPGFFSALES